jgi:putative FmdB family regulatory protein
MPLYDYHCPDCGEFRAWRPMREAGDPADCPECSRAATRVMVAPNLALVAGHTRVAHQRNERSAHEPRVMSREQLARGEAGRTGINGHSHHHHHHGTRGPEPGLHKSARPWSIGH